MNKQNLRYNLCVLFALAILINGFKLTRCQDVLLMEDFCEQALQLNRESESLRNSDRSLALIKASEALDVAEKAGCDEMMALSNSNIGVIYLFTGNYKEAEKYFETSLEMYKFLDHKPGLAAVYHRKAYLMQVQGEYEKAILLYRESIRIKDVLGDIHGITFSNENISVIYQYQGRYTEALELLLEAADLWKKSEEFEELASTLINLAAIYEIQGLYDDAYDMLKQAQEYAVFYQNNALLSIILHNLGTILFELDEYNEALEVFTSSLLLKIDLDDKAGIALNLSNIGSALRMLGRLDESNSYFSQALKIDQELGNKLGIATQLAQIAGNLLVKNEPLQSIEYYLLSNEIALEISARHLLNENFKYLITASLKAQNFAQAYEYMQKHITLSEEMAISPEELARYRSGIFVSKKKSEVSKFLKSIGLAEILLILSLSVNLLLFIAIQRKK